MEFSWASYRPKKNPSRKLNLSTSSNDYLVSMATTSQNTEII